MSRNLDDINLAYWFSNLEKHRCGYCKSETGSVSYGMTLHSLNVQDYQDLIDRGWRRSGKYCYKPLMDKTCCPQYTIRCNSQEFVISKSHKKIIKKFNKFLDDGVLNKQDEPREAEYSDCNTTSEFVIREAPENSKVDRSKLVTDEDIVETHNSHIISNPDGCSKDINQQNNEVAEHVPQTTTKKGPFKVGVGADISKPPPKKAKLIRLERKKEKLLKRGMSLESLHTSQPERKSLEDFLNDVPKHRKHNLKICLERMHRDHKYFKESAKLFAKYQMFVHNDPPDECDEEQYYYFLVSTPLKPVKFPNNVDAPGYGSFHQQYWLDDKLIAVGVIDILPKCISSVYFFYDPDYRSLTLGTYGSLRELEFTRSLYKQLPSIQYYYMGFYIHSCPKMRYKGKLVPSYLLCPETYEWFSIEKCIEKLNQTKYSRLNDDPDAVDVLCCSRSDVDDINVVYRNKLTKFCYYKRIFNEQAVFENIGRLIGKKCIKNFLFQTVD